MSEVQQDIRAIQNPFQTSHELQQCDSQIDHFSTCVKELKNEIKKGFQGLKTQSEKQQRLTSILPSVLTPAIPLIPSTSSTPLPTSVVKSDHIKLPFL